LTVWNNANYPTNIAINMDPTYFALDYERLVQVLITIVLVSIFVERALSLLFESEFFNWLIDRKVWMGYRYVHITKMIGLKEIIALFLSCAICVHWGIDALTIILVSHETTTWPGELLTGGIISGGSKVSSAIFHDFLGIMSEASKKRSGK
jgi:hypothetical protein